MTHQLDTLTILEQANKRRERVVTWHAIPEIVKKIAGHIGLLPPSDPAQISHIIEKSLAFNTFNGLISLERQGCIIRYHQLTSDAQNTIKQVLKNSQNGMEKILRAIVINIPN